MFSLSITFVFGVVCSGSRAGSQRDMGELPLFRLRAKLTDCKQPFTKL
jgi:hypothetical protein